MKRTNKGSGRVLEKGKWNLDRTKGKDCVDEGTLKRERSDRDDLKIKGQGRERS